MPSLITERIESIKGGVTAAVAFAIADLGIVLVNTFAFNLSNFNLIPVSSLEDWLVRAIIAVISGFLFGVTYRYIIRSDRNSHLQDGAVLAFGLVRGLALAEGKTISLLLLVLIIESIISFAIARIVLDFALSRKLIKPFTNPGFPIQK
ncbi:MAG: hypothetical protein QNJ70_03255 [Xenococcaceae cyanobacterium MO_207.B15]|nr:hypothetical protein [Xenococcaceae cyanobacterium MO_207.B15]MDJ0745579.1 hypothetical protein [Xenococcaceae cyanobacterium MO_167.B27]